jgi:hypothetical protein
MENDANGSKTLSLKLPTGGGDELIVAGVILGGMATLYALRKGMKGIGDFQLTGSTVGALEWAAYAAVVGGTIRVLQANFPENKIVRAVSFIY